jgi:hypothetical protein
MSVAPGLRRVPQGATRDGLQTVMASRLPCKSLRRGIRGFRDDLRVVALARAAPFRYFHSEFPVEPGCWEGLPTALSARVSLTSALNISLGPPIYDLPVLGFGALGPISSSRLQRTAQAAGTF